MQLNKLIFPSPRPSYTATTLYGKIIYIPKLQSYSIDDVKNFQRTHTLRANILSPVNKTPKMQTPKRFDFETVDKKRKNSQADTRDYEYIPCLFIECEEGSSKIMLHFHGNAEDLGNTYDLLNSLKKQLHVHIIAMEYPGYGIYEGTTNATQILDDSEHVFNFVTRLLGWRSTDVILSGRSIGSGPATWLASRKKTCCLLLISPLASIRLVVKHLFGRLSQYLVAERFKNIEYIKQVECPTFILHGMKDDLVPYQHAQELCDKCSGPTFLLLPKEMDHNSFDFYDDLARPFVQFLDNFNIECRSQSLFHKEFTMPDKLFIRPINVFKKVFDKSRL